MMRQTTAISFLELLRGDTSSRGVTLALCLIPRNIKNAITQAPKRNRKNTDAHVKILCHFSPITDKLIHPPSSCQAGRRLRNVKKVPTYAVYANGPRIKV